MQTNQEPVAPACALVIFGASGDLTKRLLLPALYNLVTYGLLSRDSVVVGVARREMDDASFSQQMQTAVSELGTQVVDPKVWQDFGSRIYYCRGEFDDPSTFVRLKEKLADLDQKHHLNGNYLFYLATQAGSFAPIVESLGQAGLVDESNGWKRVIVEKPFGRDLASSRELSRRLAAVLEEQQIYRIDHYLGKETVQNLLVLRFCNSLFEPTWNRTFIDHVQITVAESLGVEERGAFYETAGALRDVMENHMFVLLALFCMEPPSSLRGDPVRNEMVKVIQSIEHFQSLDQILENSCRGQYDGGEIDGRKIPAYRSANRVAPDSSIETYAALRLHVANWRWAGVPFYLRTGKALAKKATEIVVQFKQPPLKLLQANGAAGAAPNRMILHIQPRQGITTQFQAKLPGTGVRTKEVSLNFDYKEFGDVPRAVGYETLLYDAMIGDNTLFHRTDMVDAAWQVATPVLEAWANHPPKDFPNYQPGSQGPGCADELLQRDGRSWWTPGQT
ncbi:MAG: glucose-6-phosphate dehydrogenase [Verrucomicrobia bacterium]|nr:glucose-6-phosphate dehydrogenase [Verrucomicrobiota bacterium]